jgi:choline kinase
LLAEDGAGLRLTIDHRKRLTDEAMKVMQGADRRITRITKQMVPSAAHGEYIGTARIGADAAEELTRALKDTWADDPSLYYEDGFQLFADRGGDIRGVDPGLIEWVEVDDHADLLTARRITSAAGPGGSRYVSSGS